MKKSCPAPVEDCVMNETFPVEFIGGSRDGAMIDADNAPDHVALTLNNGRTANHRSFTCRSGMRRMNLGSEAHAQSSSSSNSS
jgi:hypothetical protein